MLQYFESGCAVSRRRRLRANTASPCGCFRQGWTGCGFGVRKLASGEIEGVFPWEDEELLNAANPVAADGQVRFDALRAQARHDAIVKYLLKGGSFGLMILGGDHDLSENVRRLGDGRCEFVRVTMKRFEQAASE